jgi:hypothetical protein
MKVLRLIGVFGFFPVLLLMFVILATPTHPRVQTVCIYVQLTIFLLQIVSFIVEAVKVWKQS